MLQIGGVCANSSFFHLSKDPLARLKKYLVLMGIKNWWTDSALKRCSSIKSKKARLLEMMEENGLKGMLIKSLLCMWDIFLYWSW